MASSLSLRALPRHLTALTPLTRLPTTMPKGTRHYALFGGSDSSESPKLAQSTQAWIAKLKETHGDRWEVVYEESRARQARNAELIREKHQQQRQEKERKKEAKLRKKAGAAAPGAAPAAEKKTKKQKQKGGEEDGGDAVSRAAQAEEAWIAQLKARHGEAGWKAAYEERQAAFKEGLAKSEKAAEAAREKSRLEKKAKKEEEKKARQAQLAMEEEMRRQEKAAVEAEGGGARTGRRRSRESADSAAF